MPQRTLPGLGLTGFWDLGFDGWKNENDANLRALSALTQLRVLGRVNVAGLPGSPTDGMIYIVLDGANANKIAVRDDGAWVYLTPTAGYLAWDVAEEIFVKFNGTAWVDFLDGLALPALPDLTEEYISVAQASSSAQIDIALPAGYYSYELEINKLYCSTGSRLMQMRCSTDGGANYIASGNRYFSGLVHVGHFLGTGKTNDVIARSSTPSFINYALPQGDIDSAYLPTTAAAATASRWEMLQPNIVAGGQFLMRVNAEVNTVVGATGPNSRNNNAGALLGQCVFSAGADRVTNIRLYPSAGTFVTGDFILKGRKLPS